MKTILFLLAFLTVGMLGSGCRSSRIEKTYTEDVTRTIESTPVIGEPVRGPARR